MPAFALTAAEIAAAEAAAIAAAEAAAIQAAQIAAAEAAAAAAAEAAAAQAAAQAGTQAAAQAGTQAATQASTNGIQALAQEVGVSAQPTGIEQVFQQAQANNIPMSQEQFLNNSFAGQGQYVDLSGAPAGQVSPNPITSVEITPQQPVPLTETTSSVTPHVFEPPVYDVQGFEGVDLSQVSTTGAPVSSTPAAESALDKYYSQRPMDMGGAQGMKSSSANASTLRPSGDPFYNINSGHIDQTLGRPGFGITDVAVEPSAMSSNLPAQPATGLQGLIDKSLAYAQANPLQTGFGAMSLYNMLNQPKPYEKPKYKSTFDPSTYKPYEPTPPNPPYRAQYAQGGIADLGGYSDYARGGRMLKGPGDGMSDDIPATIANKQPARLANEEFVIPADVVSHLGNGSSEAGAKALYKMMDRVRQARTGTKKQGKQINPEKYLA